MQAYTTVVDPESLAERERALNEVRDDYKSADPTAAELKRLEATRSDIYSRVSHEYRYQRRALAIFACVITIGFIAGLMLAPIMSHTPEAGVKGLLVVIAITAVLALFTLCLMCALNRVRSSRSAQIEAMSMEEIERYLESPL